MITGTGGNGAAAKLVDTRKRPRLLCEIHHPSASSLGNVSRNIFVGVGKKLESQLIRWTVTMPSFEIRGACEREVGEVDKTAR